MNRLKLACQSSLISFSVHLYIIDLNLYFMSQLKIPLYLVIIIILATLIKFFPMKRPSRSFSVFLSRLLTTSWRFHKFTYKSPPFTFDVLEAFSSVHAPCSSFLAKVYGIIRAAPRAGVWEQVCDTYKGGSRVT